MELYIQMRDGQPYEHPIMGDNFCEAFPHIDVNNLPSEFARFIRVPQPKIGLFEVNDGVVYTLIDGVVQDVWQIRPMTPEERRPVEEAAIERVTTFVNKLRQDAETNATTAEPEEFRQAWVSYKTLIDNWVLIDVERPAVPRPPIFVNGKVVDLNVNGDVPNVIG